MEAGPDLEQRTDPTVGFTPPRGRRRDPGQDLEHRALAGPVPSDDPDRLSGADLERDVLQGPEIPGRAVCLRTTFGGQTGDVLAKASVSTDAEAFARTSPVWPPNVVRRQTARPGISGP